jgi:hypothetical protein
MHTQVAPGEELAAGTPDDYVFAEHPSRDRATVRKLCDQRHRVPILYQDRVIDHCNFLERTGMLRWRLAYGNRRRPSQASPAAPGHDGIAA